MSKRVYISADYDEDSGDRNVVDELNRWGTDNKHKVDFVDMAKVVSGSISKDPDCRACDLKEEFNNQINASSTVIIVIGDKTALRTSGSGCPRITQGQASSTCTPYRKNAGGVKPCEIITRPSTDAPDVSKVNNYSYIRHEFEQARKQGKKIIVVYNSLYRKASWLPSYMKGYESSAVPFWVMNENNNKVGNYAFIKRELGFNG